MPRSRPKRETMLSRSERIIGKQLEDDTQEDEHATETSSNQDNLSKRRSQVLKAQRAHRRRTQNYILELEKEVLRLRKREADMIAELELQRSHSSIEHNACPPRFSSNGMSALSEQEAQATSTVSIDLSDYAHVEAGYPCSKAALGIEPDFPESTVDVLAELADSTMGSVDCQIEKTFKTDAQSAIDFILDLERPCLSHIKFDLTTKQSTPFKEPNFNYGRSHSCTASAKIIQSCPNANWASQKILLPQQIVDNLLENSRSLPLGPEMTPVQVWQLLTDVGSDQSLSFDRISFFKKELHKYMRCNAFGASIPIESLRRLLSLHFPWYNATHLHDIHVPVVEPELTIMNETIGKDWDQFF